MKTIIAVNCSLLLVLSTIFGSANGYAMTPKPRPPIQFEIQSVPLANDPTQVQFSVTTVSSVALPSAEINITLPVSMEMYEGTIVWQGALVANQAQLMSFTAIVESGNSDPIVVAAMLVNGKVQKTIAVTDYTHRFIAPNIIGVEGSIAKAGANEPIHTSVVIKQSEGRRILEYVLE